MAGNFGNRVLAVVVNYNGGRAVARCLQSLLDQTYSDLEIVVVDNASTDGSEAAIVKEFPSVRLIRNQSNSGWGNACNMGLEKGESHYVALVNNDAWLDRDCISEMVAAIQKRPEYGSCASKILTADGAKIEACGLNIVLDGSSCGRGRLLPTDRLDEEKEVFCANDCCCLYKRTMLDEIGGYDPDFFIYCDETDMGYRHQMAGWKCIYSPSALAFHSHSLAAGSYSPFKAFYVERNRLLLLWKHFPVSMIPGAFWHAFQRFLLQVWLSERNKKGALAHFRKEHSLLNGLSILMRAHLSALMLLPRMLKRRKAAARIRRMPTQEFRQLFRRFGISTLEMARYE